MPATFSTKESGQPFGGFLPRNEDVNICSHSDYVYAVPTEGTVIQLYFAAFLQAPLNWGWGTQLSS